MSVDLPNSVKNLVDSTFVRRMLMKCIKHEKTNKIVRTNDEAAELKVASGDWIFIPKQEWKEKVRDSK